jgi:hypothetical protein
MAGDLSLADYMLDFAPDYRTRSWIREAADGLPSRRQTARLPHGVADMDLRAHLAAGKKVHSRGEAIYQNLRERLEQRYPLKFIALNISTGEYVIGDSPDEAYSEFVVRFSGDCPCLEKQIDAHHTTEI